MNEFFVFVVLLSDAAFAIHVNRQRNVSLCEVSTCLRKCCPTGQFLMNKTCQVAEESFDFSGVGVAVDVLVQDHIVECSDDQTRFVLDETDEFYVEGNNLVWPLLNLSLSYVQYCIDMIDELTTPKALICYGAVVEESKVFYYSGMIISMPFLLATFLVYAILPDRNLHGKALMCYVLSLLLAYLFLVIIILHETFIARVPCLTLAYLCYFFFMASFFWMNVMCVDLWWTFSGFRGFSGRKQSEQKRFILYNVYAWGIPLLLLIIASVLNETLDEHSSLSPKMGQSKCWFEDALSTLIYFYGVLAILILFNIVCFVLTTIKIRQAKQDTAMLNKDESKRHSYQNDKQRFNLYLKLFLAMGVNWSMEVISWAVEWKLKTVPKEVFIVTDFCNAMYGVFIFFIFVCNKEKQKKLQKWYYSFTGRPMRGQSMASSSTSNPTRTTHTGLEKSVTNETILLTNNGNNH